MRRILTAAIIFGAAALSIAAPVQAQVTIRAPGMAIQAGPQPYWRQHHAEEWRSHEEFREAQHQRPEWQHDHCVRDWDGKAYCR